MPRKCAICHAPDRPELIEEAICNCSGGDCEGHAAECRKVQHWVKREIKLHEGPMTKSQKDKGWQERTAKFRGKSAIERFICAPCLEKAAQIEEIKAFRQKICDEMNEDIAPTMYQILSN